METRKVERVTIRWKPYMWWAYINDDTTSHMHGEPDDLRTSIEAVWPGVPVTIDWESAPKPTPTQGE